MTATMDLAMALNSHLSTFERSRLHFRYYPTVLETDLSQIDPAQRSALVLGYLDTYVATRFDLL